MHIDACVHIYVYSYAHVLVRAALLYVCVHTHMYIVHVYDVHVCLSAWNCRLRYVLAHMCLVMCTSVHVYISAWSCGCKTGRSMVYCMYIYTQVYVWDTVCMYIHRYVHGILYVYTQVCVSMCVCVCVCIYVYMYICLYAGI